MRISPEQDKLSLINRQNLRNHDYLRSLITEALRVNLITMPTVDDLQMQIMGQLEEILRGLERDAAAPSADDIEREPANEVAKAAAENVETDGNATNNDVKAATNSADGAAAENAETNETDNADADAAVILSGIFFTLDTYLLAFHDPMYAIAALQTGSIGEMYENGKRLLRTHFCETVSLWVRVRHTMPDKVCPSYEKTVNAEIHEVLSAFDPLRPTLLTPAFSYPLANEMWKSHGSIFAVKYYLKYLLCENHFCNLFDASDDAEGNLFSGTGNLALANAILGKYTGTLSFSEGDRTELQQRIGHRSGAGMRETFVRAAKEMLDDLLTLSESERTYVKWYARRLADAVSRAGEETESFFPVNLPNP